MPDYAAGAALIIAILTFLTTQFGLLRTASKDRMDKTEEHLQAQLDECLKAKAVFAAEVGQLRYDVAQFRRENYDLLARVADLTKGVG